MDILLEDVGIRQLPNLPQNICGSSMVAPNGTILLCGGFENEKKCLQLDHGTWKEHSTLNVERAYILLQQHKLLHSSLEVDIQTAKLMNIFQRTPPHG